MILDLSMPKLAGISALKEIKGQFPETKILVFAIHLSDQNVRETFEAGADGYCLKDAGRKELIVAIDSVLSGDTYLSPRVAEQVMEGYIEGSKRMKNHFYHANRGGTLNRIINVFTACGGGTANRR